MILQILQHFSRQVWVGYVLINLKITATVKETVVIRIMGYSITDIINSYQDYLAFTGENVLSIVSRDSITSVVANSDYTKPYLGYVVIDAASSTIDLR